MKYVEHVKSAVLFLLVMLSVVLTFAIWTFTPDYKYIEQTEGKKIEIGAKKSIDNVIKPYKAIFRMDDAWTGTVSSDVMKDLMNDFGEWTALDLVQINSNISPTYLNEMVRTNNRMTVFFSGEVPFSVLNSIFQFTDKELPETTFNRMIIDWSEYNYKELQVFFVSGNNTSFYRSHVRIPNANEFKDKIIEPSKAYSVFKEVERDGFTSLYVTNDKVESVKYTYYIDEDSPELFKDVLFTDPNVVQRSIESATSEEYSDGMSLMTVDTQFKSLNYVYPAAETSTRSFPSKLLKDSFEFVNEHGGFKGDYRYASMNPSNNQVDYQLYLQGAPVFSDQAITRITTVWGDTRIFRYKRPYYSLDMAIKSEKDKELPSGTEIIEKIHHLNSVVLSDIDEIVVGYYLTKDEDQQLFMLETSWFILSKGTWNLLTPEMLGGVQDGLE